MVPATWKWRSSSDQFQDVQQLAGVSAAVAHQRLAFLDLDVLLLEEDVLFDRPFK